MLMTLIMKELKSLILGPKFVTTFAVCSILFLLSVYVGIREYNAAVRQYDTARRLTEQEIQEATSWGMAENRLHRAPDPMQIFVAGTQNDIGRLSAITPSAPVKLTNSVYADDPIYAVFRFIDAAFIIQVVFSLFAILFTYNAINGERETGTLQLTFANDISRVQYVVGKAAGSWLGLMVPLAIPLLLAVLMVRLSVNSLTIDYWLRLGMFLGISVLFFTFFVAFGILISTLTKRSSVSFMICLVCWVMFVLIIPRTGIMAAGQATPVPSVAETEGVRDSYAKDCWAEYMKDMEVRWQERSADLGTMTKEERKIYQDSHEQQWMDEEEKARKIVEEKIDKFATSLREDLRNREQAQQRLGFGLARISPAAEYQLAAMSLAGTGIDLKSRYEDAMQRYRTAFIAFREKKLKESGGFGGIRITVDSDRGFSLKTGREQGTLDVGEMPTFEPPHVEFAEAASPALLDTGLLAVFTVIAFAAAFVAFLRYDVR
jgi:ABC-type transport system involved in multi-copper enzyme maturation permease subunit